MKDVEEGFAISVRSSDTIQFGDQVKVEFLHEQEGNNDSLAAAEEGAGSPSSNVAFTMHPKEVSELLVRRASEAEFRVSLDEFHRLGLTSLWTTEISVFRIDEIYVNFTFRVLKVCI